MSANANSGVVIGGGKKRLHVGPRARLAIIIAVGVLLLAGLATGGYLFWQHQKSEKMKQAISDNSAKVQAAHVEDIKKITVPEGADKTGLLRVQTGTVYAQGDYATAVSYANELLAVPGYENDTDALRYLAKSYEELGKKTEAKQAWQRMITYYDAHPDEKSNARGKVLYAEAKEGIK